MKHFKQIIIYVSILSLLLVTIFTSNPLKVYAEVPTSQKAIPHSSTWGNYDFNYAFHRKYWVIEDPTGIPTSPLTAPYYFYTDDGVTFFDVNGGSLIQLVLTRGLSLVLEPTRAQALILAFFNEIGRPKDIYYDTFVQGGVYDAQNNFLGYALNDISNCYYEGISVPENVTVPDQTVDNVKNFYDYSNDTNYPDYITVTPSSAEFALSKMTFFVYPNSPLENQAYELWYNENFVQTITDNYNYYDYVYATDSTNNDSQFKLSRINNVTNIYKLNPHHYIQDDTGATYWNNFCDFYDLKDGQNELLGSEFYLKRNAPSNTYIKFSGYDSSDTKITTYPRISLSYNSSTQTVTPSDSTTTINNLYLGKYSTLNYTEQIGNSLVSHTGNAYHIMLGKQYTIYKDYETYKSINVDKDYRPDTFTGTNYYNYNYNNDNSITTNTTEIDNSQTVNGDIYDDIDDSFNTNVDNSTVNNTNISNETNNIINIYYPGGNPGPTPPDPDNPTDPDNPIEDDTILDGILAALKRFFDVIGKILGTVLAGLLEVIDALLESIAGIMDNLTGLTEFLAALFSWIPSPVPQILALGFSICVLAAIIKFIRG